MEPLQANHTDDSRNQAKPNRRLTERMPTEFPVIYSGMHEGDMLMADGTITNASGEGLGINGSRTVCLGMELALFIDLPGLEDPLCIARSRVSWVRGPRFGIEMPSHDHGGRQLRFHAWTSDVRQSHNASS